MERVDATTGDDSRRRGDLGVVGLLEDGEEKAVELSFIERQSVTDSRDAGAMTGAARNGNHRRHAGTPIDVESNGVIVGVIENSQGQKRGGGNEIEAGG